MLELFGVISAVIEFAFEQLHGNYGEDELEQDEDDENVEHVLQRVDHAIEHGLEFRNALDGLQRSKYPEDTERFHRG